MGTFSAGETLPTTACDLLISFMTNILIEMNSGSQANQIGMLQRVTVSCHYFKDSIKGARSKPNPLIYLKQNNKQQQNKPAPRRDRRQDQQQEGGRDMNTDNYSGTHPELVNVTG